MLPPAHRMRRSSDFASIVRHGRRVRQGTIVLHQGALTSTGSPLVGLVVGRSVGGSVVRHQLSRRLRAQLAERLAELPAGSGTVVRALPPAAHAESKALGADLDTALRRIATDRRPRSAAPAGETQ